MLSYPENIPAIIKAIIDIDPKVILDVGPGYGKYSILAREAIYSNRAALQKDLLPTEDVVVHCCEGTKYFQNSYAHNALYSQHYHFDFFNLPIDIRNRYDLILLIDCIEHWDKEVALDQLHHTPAPILISTPKNVNFYTDEYYHAIHGPHITQWHRGDFEDNFLAKNYSTDFSWIYVLPTAT